jgi:hypothetical protein
MNHSTTEYFHTSIYNIPLLNESLSNWVFIYNYLQYSSIERIPQQLNIYLQESTIFPCWMNLSETEYFPSSVYDNPLLNESISNWIFIYNYNIPLLKESLSNWIFTYRSLQYSPVEWIPQQRNIYLQLSTIFLYWMNPSATEYLSTTTIFHYWRNLSATEYLPTGVYNIPLLNESLSNGIVIYNYLQYSSIEWIPQQLNIYLQESTIFPFWINLSETEYFPTSVYDIPLLNESLRNWIFP